MRRLWRPVRSLAAWSLNRGGTATGSDGLRHVQKRWIVTAPVKVHYGFVDYGLREVRFVEYGLKEGRYGSRMVGCVRWGSSSSAVSEEQEAGRVPSEVQNVEVGLRKGDLVKSEYWGITPKSFVSEDGTKWPWNSFRPADAYAPDLNIDIKKHYLPDGIVDKLALWTVQTLRYGSDLFFQRRHVSHALLLETIAAVPGMVAGMLLHCRSIRRFEQSGGWIKAMLEEAENERMHLMTMMELKQPVWWERALIFIAQGVWFNSYFVLYVLSPRLAHRITGYLEEEAVRSYTNFITDIDSGYIPNTPAPAIARDYWKLKKDATVRDVITVIRADEAHHRDVNHFASDIRKTGKQLNETPAPVGYH